MERANGEWEFLFEKLKAENTQLRSDLEQSREAEEKGFHRGLMHKSVPRGMVSVHGTDGCYNCETGRITLYAASRYCTECEHKAASTEGGKGGGG